MTYYPVFNEASEVLKGFREGTNSLEELKEITNRAYSDFWKLDTGVVELGEHIECSDHDTTRENQELSDLMEELESADSLMKVLDMEIKRFND